MPSSDSLLISIGTGLELGAVVLVSAEAFLFVERGEDGSRSTPGIRLMNWFTELSKRTGYRPVLRRLGSVSTFGLLLIAIFVLVSVFALESYSVTIIGLFVLLAAQMPPILFVVYPALAERIVSGSLTMLGRHLRTFLLLFSAVFGVGVLLQFIAATF